MMDRITIDTNQQMDRGLAYGEACFETFRVIDGKVFAWDYHWHRLTLGLQSFGIHMPSKWNKEVYQSCLNRAQETAQDCLVRLTVSGGTAAWGLTKMTSPNVYIQALPYTPSQSQSLCMFSTEYPYPLREKKAKFTSDYAETLRAIQVWKSKTPDLNPQQIIICKDEQIISGLTSNILLYQKGQWFTPAGSGVLKGTIREFLIKKEVVQPQTCSTTLLHTCESILLINSGQILSHVQSINKRELQPNHPDIHTIKEVLGIEQGIAFTSV